MPIYTLPTFVRTALAHYKSKRQLADDYLRFRALEAVYATVVKYVGTTFALIAADYDTDLADAAHASIFDSSSLGGWLDAVEIVCHQATALPDCVRDHCTIYSDYQTHGSRDSLDTICDHINAVVHHLRTLGYALKPYKHLTITRVLRSIVTIRNKCAHGAQDPLFFSQVEPHLFAALRLLLTVIPFSVFTLWGKHGSNSVKLVEYPPPYSRRAPRDHFWIESHLLSNQFTTVIPFLSYKPDSKTVYCLNATVAPDGSASEFIDYDTGYVIYREVPRTWPQMAPSSRRLIRPARHTDYNRHIDVLTRDFIWTEIPLVPTHAHASVTDVGVYLFTTPVALGQLHLEVILYVGKTTNLQERLRSYLRIKYDYDDNRPWIKHMFSVYKEHLKMLFTPIPRDQLPQIERAIYETTMPEYNLITPPAN